MKPQEMIKTNLFSVHWSMFFPQPFSVKKQCPFLVEDPQVINCHFDLSSPIDEPLNQYPYFSAFFAFFAGVFL